MGPRAARGRWVDVSEAGGGAGGGGGGGASGGGRWAGGARPSGGGRRALGSPREGGGHRKRGVAGDCTFGGREFGVVAGNDTEFRTPARRTAPDGRAAPR